MLAALRSRIDAVVAPPATVRDTLPTGLPALDAALPGGGLPCGRLTELSGPAGLGATTVIRALVASALAAGRWVAYIDNASTLSAADWAPLADSGRLWVVRPPVTDHGPWCADLLLRSQAFGLVILDDSTPIARAVAIRLTRLAQESNTAFVVLHQRHDWLTGSTLRLQMQPLDEPAPIARLTTNRWQRLGDRLSRAATGRPTTAPASPLTHGRIFRCAITRGGTHGPSLVEISCVNDLAHHLRPDSTVPDRRGVAPRNRLGDRTVPGTPGVARTTPPPDPVGGTVLPRKRRCAEPAIARDTFLLAPQHDDSPPPPPADTSYRTQRRTHRTLG